MDSDLEKRPYEAFTVRESQVHALLMLGASNQEICEDLEIALPTVKLHVGKVARKLDVKTRAEVIVKTFALMDENDFVLWRTRYREEAQ